MKLSEYIRLRSGQTSLPIDVEEDILPEILKNSKVREAYPWRDVNLNAEDLQGYCLIEEIPDQANGSYWMATIGYAASTEEKERFICCKEMLHMLDPDVCRPDNIEEAKALAKEIALPAELVDPVTLDHALTDRMMTWLAGAVLLPLKVRAILLADYKAGTKTIADIADLAEIPTEIAAMVMSARWPEALEAIIKIVESLENQAQKKAAA